MSAPCPDHPRTLGATLGNCTACTREAVPADRARQLAATVRAQVRRPTRPARPARPEPDETDLSAARARIDDAKEA